MRSRRIRQSGMADVGSARLVILARSQAREDPACRIFTIILSVHKLRDQARAEACRYDSWCEVVQAIMLQKEAGQSRRIPVILEYS